ncbi:MAG: ADP-heptose--LPS heptosyltransferase [Rhodospirillaceae bacterium]|nr:ADP-heptose--LPS heptosyltransferase [Rhodospirillaceae bacterium]
MSNTAEERILVVKLGALGDFVQAFAPFQAIREHHPSSHITLLTMPAFSALGNATGWFDAVWIDSRPEWWRFGTRHKLRKFFNQGGFKRVYDLQTSKRSSSFYRSFKRPRPEWSGIANGCSHPHSNPDRNFMHTIERQAEQLTMAGVRPVLAPDLSWFDADTTRFRLEDEYFLIVPGGAAHRPEKRWPVKRYIQLANDLVAWGRIPVLLGGEEERDVLDAIARECRQARNLGRRTNIFDIAGLARLAIGAIGNDTGPMHIISAVGCPSVVLYSHASNPDLCGQRGLSVKILRRAALEGLAVAEVEAALQCR